MKKIIALFFTAVALSGALYADQIVLKDEQSFEAEVKSFDSYYLVVELSNMKQVSIPWSEVRQVKHTTTASSWLEETYMNNDNVEVTSMITPLDGGKAFQKALFPGLIIHGSGHFYAKEQNTGFSLMSAEILSLVMMGISVNELLTPVAKDQSFNVSRAVFYTGLGMFSISWLWDVVFAPRAVSDYNESHSFLINEKSDKIAADSSGNTENNQQEIKK
jgi:hypothetical protein